MDRGVRRHNFLLPGIVGLLWLVWGTIPQSLYGAPSISSVSGTISDGQTITIKGSGFGETGPTVLIYDDYEKGSSGKSFSIGTGAAVGSWTSFTDVYNSLHYSSSYAHSGALSLEKNTVYANDDPSPRVNLNFSPALTDGDQVFISYWLYVPTNHYYPGNGTGIDQAKVHWLHFEDSGMFVGWTHGWNINPNYSDYSCLNSSGYGLYSGVGEYHCIFTKGIWTRFWFWHSFGSSSNGSIQAYAMNANTARLTILNTTGKTNVNASHPYDQLNIPAYVRATPSGNGPASLFYDDVYVAKGAGARARVEIGNNSTYTGCTNLSIFTSTSWSDTSITATIRQGSFSNGGSAFLFVVDANGTVSSQGYPIILGGGSADAVPAVNITSPTSESNYVASQATMQIAGSASDDEGVANVTWTNSRGGSGNAVNNSGNWSSWSTGNISLQEGENIITVTAMDTANQSTTDTLTVTYSTSGTVQAWSATAQTGDSSWASSTVTYCVRLLIEGSSVTQSGSQIQLGIQGRTSGSYTIRKVSIAERDTTGLEGDVVDSTWTKVTFDGNSAGTWATDVITVPAGQEKLSNIIPFMLHAGKDYYVTFKIVTASVYLNPPSTYRELYFYSADHTDDIDWGQNGHDSTQDYHALSRINVIPGSTGVGPAPPKWNPDRK